MNLQTMIYPICFCFELLICESIFLLHQRRRPRFPLRLALSLIVYLAAMIGLNELYEHIDRTMLADILFFLSFFAGSMAMMPVCFRLTLPQAFFVAAAGYSVEHIADSLLKIVLRLVTGYSFDSFLLLVLLLILPYVCVAALFYFLMIKKAMLDEKLRYSDRRVLAVSAMNLCICMVLSVATDHAEFSNEAFLICKIYAILGCMLCLITQVGLFRDGKMARTNRILQQMMEMERSQHQLSRETIDLINIRCHDLRHQIDRLNNLSDEKRQKSVEELSRAIMIYDSIVKTGSEALDTILMEKKLLCEKYHIRFSFVGDGKLLSMLDEVDVYALFGNMLDNAIESLQKEPDEEKRLITLRIYARMKMLYIEVDNYFSTPLLYKNGEIQTSKRHEPGMHGYGIKSIAFIVNQYKGDLLITTENNHFVLQIMLPQTGEDD